VLKPGECAGGRTAHGFDLGGVGLNREKNADFLAVRCLSGGPGNQTRIPCRRPPGSSTGCRRRSACQGNEFQPPSVGMSAIRSPSTSQYALRSSVPRSQSAADAASGSGDGHGRTGDGAQKAFVFKSHVFLPFVFSPMTILGLPFKWQALRLQEFCQASFNPEGLRVEKGREVGRRQNVFVVEDKPKMENSKTQHDTKSKVDMLQSSNGTKRICGHLKICGTVRFWSAWLPLSDPSCPIISWNQLGRHLGRLCRDVVPVDRPPTAMADIVGKEHLRRALRRQGLLAA